MANSAQGLKNEEGRPHNKFLTAELIIGSMFTLTIDGISAALDSTGVGYILASILQGTTVLAITWWVHSKGGDRAWGLERQLKKQFANFLPWVPTTFIIFIVDAYQHNHPKLAKITKKAAGSSS